MFLWGSKHYLSEQVKDELEGVILQIAVEEEGAESVCMAGKSK